MIHKWRLVFYEKLPTATAAPLQHSAALKFLRCHPALWSPPTPPSGIITDCQDAYWPRWTQLDPAPGSRKHTLTHIHASCTLRWGGFCSWLCCLQCEWETQAPAVRKGGKCERGERKGERPDMKLLLTSVPDWFLLFFLGGESAHRRGGPRHGSEPGFHFPATCES